MMPLNQILTNKRDANFFVFNAIIKIVCFRKEKANYFCHFFCMCVSLSLNNMLNTRFTIDAIFPPIYSYTTVIVNMAGPEHLGYHSMIHKYP